jgi:endonuclease/exonuclease/phosphatase (EEP) superfamily protein YafD
MCLQGKLDWVLLRGLQVVGKAIGNHDYAASDHKWLMVDVRVA